jgi:deoxyinosine 3'endonuclease (endonuclease V)
MDEDEGFTTVRRTRGGKPKFVGLTEQHSKVKLANNHNSNVNESKRKRDHNATEHYHELWKEEQEKLKTKQLLTDPIAFDINQIKYIGGVDISFYSGRDNAVASLVVTSFPDMKVVHEVYLDVRMKLPYVSGFLGFREIPHLLKLLEKIRQEAPKFYPDVILVDGNGVLHPREFGCASHFGVVAGIPTIGVAKTIMMVDGINQRYVDQLAQKYLHTGNDTCDLIGNSGKCYGRMLRPINVLGNESKDPIFISIGHNVCLDTSVEIVKRCCSCRIPEPIRQADLRSRAIIRERKISKRINV